MDYKEIIAEHELYWNTDGKEGAIANLSGANLNGANLNGANLRGANLRDANLRDANLSVANLSDANLRDANLRDANLRGANLRDANLRDANLRDANLRDANLRGANLRDANLRGANLSGANLSDANLSDANLSDANLSGANLSVANLSSANLSDANLSGAIGIAPITENAIAILLDVADRVVGNPHALKMKYVHTCNTTHCGAGWVCHLSPIAATLEKILGWNVAACIVCPIPEFTGLFYAKDAEMMAFLESVKGDRGESLRAKYLCPQ
jgi:hypothetical protein